MSETPTDTPITLEFLAQQQGRILSEIGILRDDMMVLSAIVRRMDATMAGMLEEIRAVHAQHARLDHRVAQIENRT